MNSLRSQRSSRFPKAKRASDDVHAEVGQRLLRWHACLWGSAAGGGGELAAPGLVAVLSAERDALLEEFTIVSVAD